ncbi:MAG: hypothetical protein IJ316_03220 [Clostridia bacterium]|nr:hypothetical protein [Clostridia bacterium]
MKKNFIVSALVFMLISVIAFASVTSSTITPIIPVTPIQPVSFDPSFDSLAQHMGYDTDEKFDAFHKTALFMGRYCTDQKSFSYIEQMILSGCDPQTTMDIYQFYLTTNEDISIVKQIYDMVYTGEPITNRDVVFENAFNKITNNKCGVLTEEDVIDYLEKGLSVDDIVQANLLCRKGVMTIHEILDALLSGTSWETIIETISGEDITLSDTTTVASATRAMTVSSATNQKLSTVLSGNNEEERIANITRTVNETLKSKGYWKGKKSENFALIVKDAEKKGISETKLTELMDKGYSELDIINTINNPDCTVHTIDTVAESQVTK